MAVYSISYYCTEIYSSLAFPCTVKFGTLGRVGGMLCNHVARYKPHVGQNYFSIRCWMVVEFEFELRAPNIPIRMLGIRNEHRLNNLCPAPINNMQKSECVQYSYIQHPTFNTIFFCVRIRSDRRSHLYLKQVTTSECHKYKRNQCVCDFCDFSCYFLSLQ